MVCRGTIESEVVVLPAGVRLPEGAEVLVAVRDQGDESAAGPAIREKRADHHRRAARLPPDLAANPAPCAALSSRQDGPAAESTEVRVHEPKVTVVQQPPWCGGMRADPAAAGPKATTEGASVSSDRSAQRDCRIR